MEFISRFLIVPVLITSTACAPVQIDFVNQPSGGPSCVEGEKLGVWLDLDSDGSTDGERFVGSFIAYEGSKLAAENYNYYSASAHPIVGPTPSGFKSTVFFYQDTHGLSFNFFSNVDAGGSKDNIVEWDIATSGNNLRDDVILSDDHLELSKTGSSGGEQYYAGRFHYWSNTDGGVIGPFADKFRIAVKVLRAGDVIDAAFYSADGSVLPLRNGAEPVSSFIVGYQGHQTCQ